MSDYKSLLPSDKIKDYENEYYIYHSVQSHISTIDERGKATERLNMGMPDMLYGKNELSIKSKTKDFELNFNPYDALDKCHEYFEKYPEVKVIEAESWKITKQNFKELPHNYDWTYSTTYLGTFKGSCKYEIIENSGKLPMDKLTDTTDKVEFFDSLYLYEDELCDNGEVTLNIKIRVMSSYIFILQRYFMQLRDVIIRVIDTRYYIPFEGDIVRDVSIREKIITGNPSYSQLIKVDERYLEIDLISERTDTIHLLEL